MASSSGAQFSAAFTITTSADEFAVGTTVFCSTSSGGGQETTITSFWNTLAHLGMTIVPLGYRDLTITDLTEARGGGPYGAAAFSKGQGERPSAKEMQIARTQGRILAEIALKLNR